MSDLKLQAFINPIMHKPCDPIVEIDDALNEAISEALNEALNGALKSDDAMVRLRKVMRMIYEEDGASIPDIIKRMQVSRTTAQRDIRTLKELQIVKFKGAKKTGKYLLTNKTLKKMGKKK